MSGDDPMTSAQASSLKTLSEQAREPAAYDPELTRAEASRRIDGLKAKLRLAKRSAASRVIARSQVRRFKINARAL
jgi:hypothetical protein